MIIISNRPGQLGNLLFIYAHFLAYSLENNITLLNPAFYQYRSYFSTTSAFSFSRTRVFYTFCYLCTRILIKLKIKTKFINAIALDWGETVDLKKAPELKSDLCFAQGWLFRSDDLVNKYKENIKVFFKPTKYYKNELSLFFKQKFSNSNETKIAVHIRQGDYKNFENGKYYYSIDDYLNIIKNLAFIFKDKHPHFLICHNEKITLNEKENPDLKITFAPGHELLDMYCMATCDYIVGPPSTYSMWASFYGNAPLYMIKDLKKEINLDDFKIV
ncbi:MAG: hypothetical protein ABIP51_08375 [Bacteroidia bacterium]